AGSCGPGAARPWRGPARAPRPAGARSTPPRPPRPGARAGRRSPRAGGGAGCSSRGSLLGDAGAAVGPDAAGPGREDAPELLLDEAGDGARLGEAMVARDRLE